jgi:putative glutamine amidotransferase
MSSTAGSAADEPEAGRRGGREPAEAGARVGITCSRQRPRAYYETYARAVARAGGRPRLLAPDEVDRLEELDGLLLPGGPDIDPKLYGDQADPDLGSVDAELDHFEIDLVRRAVARHLPVLGICRGQQVINVALGGTLHQHLPEHDRHGLPRTHLAHEIRVEAGSELEQAADGSPVMVNSLHHQAIKDVAAGLRVTARSPDGVAEALEGERVVAVQCHPEELMEESAWARRLLERFVERARRSEPC